MAAFRRGKQFLPSLLQCRTKFSSRMEKNKVLPRRIFEIVTQPILPEMLQPALKQCSYNNKLKTKEELAKEEENLYEQFLIRRCREMFDNNKMIIICGRLPMTKRDNMLIGKAYKRNNIQMKIWSNEVVKKTIDDTQWASLDPLLLLHNCYITSPEICVKDALKVVKKTPQLFVLAGVVENRILSKDELVYVSNLPPLDQLLGQTVSLLGSAASKTHSLLSSHQQELSSNLQQYIKDQTEKEEA